MCLVNRLVDRLLLKIRTWGLRLKERDLSGRELSGGGV